MPRLSITNTQSIHSAFTLEPTVLVYVIFCFILSLIQSHFILFGYIWSCTMHSVLNVLFSSFASLLFVWNFKMGSLMYVFVNVHLFSCNTDSIVCFSHWFYFCSLQYRHSGRSCRCQWHIYSKIKFPHTKQTELNENAKI